MRVQARVTAAHLRRVCEGASTATRRMDSGPQPHPEAKTTLSCSHSIGTAKSGEWRQRSSAPRAGGKDVRLHATQRHRRRGRQGRGRQHWRWQDQRVRRRQCGRRRATADSAHRAKRRCGESSERGSVRVRMLPKGYLWRSLAHRQWATRPLRLST